MRIPRSATSFLIALEAIAMVVVLVLCVVHPWTTKPKNDLGGNHTENVGGQLGTQENTENLIGSAGSETEMESEIAVYIKEEQPMFPFDLPRLLLLDLLTWEYMFFHSRENELIGIISSL